MIKNNGKFNKTITWFSFSLVFSLVLVSCLLPKVTEAAGASLSIYPQRGSFTVGNTFDVSIFLNTGGENVNVVQADLKFDPKKLQVITPAKEISAVESWLFPPTFSNTKGTITLQGGFPLKGINTSEGLISIITFEVISEGRTEVNFLDSSKVLLSDGKGTDILASVNRGIYDLVPSPPKGPKIFSETHPDQNKWSKNSSPVFSWEKVEDSKGYSYKLDDDPFGEPDNIVETESNSASFEEVADGIQYFHLKAKKGEVWGGTSHFKIKIDRTSPREFEPYLEPFSFTRGDYLLIYFETNDALSEIDHYEIRIADFTNPEDVILSGWTREESPFRLATEKQGTFRVLIRAFDNAGNFQEGKIGVRIFGFPLVIVSGGIQVRGIFIPWWIIYFIIGVILLIAGYPLFKWIRIKSETIRVKLKREVKEAEKEIEDVRKLERRIKEMRFLEEEAKKEEERLTERLRNK